MKLDFYSPLPINRTVKARSKMFIKKLSVDCQETNKTDLQDHLQPQFGSAKFSAEDGQEDQLVRSSGSLGSSVQPPESGVMVVVGSVPRGHRFK